MYTRCPQCKIVHPLNAALVSHARGLVQCGECGRTFSALSFLFDSWPSGQAHGPARGPNVAPPVLKSRKESGGKPPVPEDDVVDETGTEPRHIAWALATALLVLLTVANAAWTFREPLLGIPAINAWMTDAGWLQTEPEGLLRDPQKVQLVSRDMHTHPTRSGILVLSLCLLYTSDAADDLLQV